MPPLRFYEDLAEAQNSEISRVSDIGRGDDSGALKFTYHHETLSGPVTIHMMAHDCMSYPKNSGFIVFSEFDNLENDFTPCLDAVCEKQKWTNIEEAVRIISAAITAAIERRNDDVEDGPEESSWEDESDFEELDPIEISSNDGDRRPRPGQYVDTVQTNNAKTLGTLKSSLRKAQSSGITIGIYPRVGSKIPEIISLSAPASCLGVANGILESWGLKESDNLVLLLKIGGLYPSLDEYIKLSSRQTVLQFRFGKCVGQKPSHVSVQSAYRDTRQFSPDDDVEAPVADEAQFPFELINMSSSIKSLLNADFMRLLGTRRNHKLSWPNAQQIVSRLELQSAGGNIVAEDINVEILSMQVDKIPWQSLVGPISQDGALDDTNSFSLPLVAMQLALHRLANCTRYCMVCNACLDQGHSALKPYVCSNSLCLFQYLSLGLGSSIEDEIIRAPYVVDMLICFLYAALANFTAREMPDGLSIKTAYVDDDWAQGSYVAAVADMELMKLRDLDDSRLRAKSPGQPYGEALREGDRVLIIHREPDSNSEMDFVVKSWCRLVAFVDGEWTFERYHFYESKSIRRPSQPDSESDELSNEVIKGMEQGNWRRVHLFGYWQNIDEFALDRRRLALLTILDGLPSVLDMRKYLLAQPGRQLMTWSRINSSELAVLNWTVASNRSLIVQDDIVADQAMPDVSSRKPWNKVCTSEHLQHSKQSWMQFRFLQGSPEMEQKFEHKANQMLQTTKTPTIFAWHGSRLKNWHSIIRTGLDFITVENGRACGNGVYFSHDMSTSLGYSGGGLLGGDQTNVIGHWAKSELQIDSAIAVCELINSPGEFVNHHPHYVVDALHWIQCRYLLVSINPTTKAKEFPLYEPPTNDFPGYVLQDAARLIKASKRVVEIPIVAIPFDRRARQNKEPSQASAVTAKTPSPEGITPSKCNYDKDDIAAYLGEINADNRVSATSLKRRGSSTLSDFSSLSLLSNKRAKAADGRTIRAQTRNPSGFDPQGLKLESLRLLAAPTWVATSKEAVRRLTMDLKDLHHQQTALGDLSSGYYVHTDKSDNMFQWIVELFDFDVALPLAVDMKASGCASIVLEFRFGPSYPMSPPFVRVVRPQFVPFMQGGGGHVTAGGAVCLELLTSSGWNPAINIDNVIMQIRAAIGESDRPARLQKGASEADYGIGEAVAAFTRLANAHGWQVPEDFQHLAVL